MEWNLTAVSDVSAVPGPVFKGYSFSFIYLKQFNSREHKTTTIVKQSQRTITTGSSSAASWTELNWTDRDRDCVRDFTGELVTAAVDCQRVNQASALLALWHSSRSLIHDVSSLPTSLRRKNKLPQSATQRNFAPFRPCLPDLTQLTLRPLGASKTSEFRLGPIHDQRPRLLCALCGLRAPRPFRRHMTSIVIVICVPNSHLPSICPGYVFNLRVSFVQLRFDSGKTAPRELINLVQNDFKNIYFVLLWFVKRISGIATEIYLYILNLKPLLKSISKFYLPIVTLQRLLCWALAVYIRFKYVSIMQLMNPSRPT